MSRTINVITAVILLLATSPLLLLIAILVVIDSPGKVIFSQKRVGRDGIEFNIYKFRTMINDAVLIGPNLTRADDSRITRIGSFLRRWKLDELPQLVNVISGNMNLVGPRPETPDFVRYYSKSQRRVLTVNPGMTSIASVVYRKEEYLLKCATDPIDMYINVIMPAKLLLDLDYITQRSTRLDLIIISRTIATYFH